MALRATRFFSLSFWEAFRSFSTASHLHTLYPTSVPLATCALGLQSLSFCESVLGLLFVHVKMFKTRIAITIWS